MLSRTERGSVWVLLHIAYFGLPLGALLLARDGHSLDFCVLPPISAPGARRLGRICARVLDAERLGPHLEGAVEAELQKTRPDLLVSWFWTRRLPLGWLERARLDAIGVHPSLLPRHRGRNPYYWAIDSGDLETGVTVHRLSAEYDQGAILDQEHLTLGDKNAWQLARALDRPSLRALRRTVTAYAAHTPPKAIAQDETGATSAPEPSGDLLHVDFRWPTERVLRRIRALSPVPGVPLSLWGLDFFVTAAAPSDAYTRALLPGEAELSAERLLLRTLDGAITVERATLAETEGTEPSEPTSGQELATLLKSFQPRLE